MRLIKFKVRKCSLIILFCHFSEYFLILAQCFERSKRAKHHQTNVVVRIGPRFFFVIVFFFSSAWEKEGGGGGGGGYSLKKNSFEKQDRTREMGEM